MTKAEEPMTQYSPTRPTLPFERILSGGGNEMQTHLKHLESILRMQGAPQQPIEFKSPSLPNISELHNRLGGPRSMLLPQNTGSVFPPIGLSAYIPTKNPIQRPGFVQQQGMTPNTSQLSKQSDYLQGVQKIQTQINRINLLNSLIDEQQNRNKHGAATKPGGTTDLVLGRSTSDHLPLNPLINDNRTPHFYPGQFGKTNSQGLIKPNLSYKGDLNRHIYSTQELGRSTALSDGSSPTQIKHISLGAQSSLWEIAELKKCEQNPSLTSLDEEINDKPTQTTNLTQPTNPTFNMSLHSQFEGLNISKDDPGILSKRSYGSLIKTGLFDFSQLHSYSLPDLGILQSQNPKNFERIESEDSNSQPYRYGTRSVPGIYSKEERNDKILKYKKKIIKWRVAHPVNRNFSGRSVVAGTKPRIRGKFVSNEEYMSYQQKEKIKKESELGLSEKSSQSNPDMKIEECS